MRLSVAMIVTCTLGFAGTAFAADPDLKCAANTKQVKSLDAGSGNVTFKCVGTAKGTMSVCMGAFMEQYSNGKVSAQGQCVDGLMTGKWTYFTREGVKTTEIDFAKGAYHGAKTEFFPNGMVKRVEKFNGGAPVGPAQEFDVTGKPVQVVTR